MRFETVSLIVSILSLLFAIFVLIVTAGCSSSTAPSPLPCDVLKEVVTLPDGTVWHYYVNARGEECSILTPAR